MEWVFWLILGFIALVFQLHSALTNNKWGMLTNSIRWLRARLLGRLVVLPGWVWLTWHWLIEPRELGPSIWPDIIAVFVGIVLAIFVDYSDYHKHKDELSTHN